MKTAKFISTGLAGAVLMTGMNCFAQNPRQDSGEKQRTESIQQEKILIDGQGEGSGKAFFFASAGGQGQGENTFVFLSSELSLDGKVVKNAPYSADAVTETTQTLSDGNKIVHRTTASVYRDNDGRTRKDQTVNSIGPYVSSGQTPQSVFIHDPVSGVSYVLDSTNKIARKMVSFNIQINTGDKKTDESTRQDLEMTLSELHTTTTTGVGSGTGQGVSTGVGVATAGGTSSGVGTGNVTYSRRAAVNAQADANGISRQAPKIEALGTQMIEGVAAEGKRTTMTIPAGQIGNEREINIVNETWYSSELQTIVMSKRTDPMSGDMTYRLTNINRSEPAHSLFEVPGDYTIKETGTGMSMPRRTKLVD